MRGTKNFLAAISLGVALNMTANAQVNEQLAEFQPDIEAARSIMQTERKILIMREMSLTPEEADAFWPLYDEYVVARRALGDRRVKIITDYAASYGSMTDELARQLADESLDYESDALKLKKKYVKKFRKILPEVKVVRYFQLESKLDAIVEFDLASKIPLME